MSENHYWFVFYGDFSGFAVFEQELDALRYAVDRRMDVMKVPFGVDAREYVNETYVDSGGAS